MSFPRYPVYKDSDVEWLGSVPEHWTVCATGHRLAYPPCYGVLVPDFDPNGVPMLKIMDLGDGVPDIGALTTISEKLSNEYQRTLVRCGDVVLSVVGTIGSVLVVPEALGGINLSRALARLIPDGALSPHWLKWIFSSDNFTRFVDLVCVGTAQRVLNMDDLRAFRAPFPPLDEQAIINSFLDRETAKIDALVAEQEQLITLLKEKRQAVISHAVTKGLDPSVPMKDSGVKWLGEVPEHWDVKALKFVATVQTGVAKGKDNTGKETVVVPYLRVANVQDGYLALDDMAEIEIPSSDLPRYLLRSGDVLMNEGGDFDKLGRGHVWRAEIEPCIHQNHVFAVRPHSVAPEWLNTVTSSSYAQFYFMSRSKQSTNLASISSTSIMELPVVLPPPSEQEKLLAFLEHSTAQLKSLIEEAVLSIELLRERRSALISAAVTGQIDVRGLGATKEAA